MVDQKPSGDIYQSPEYQQILKKYWNNGTAQIQDPYEFIEDIRQSLLHVEETGTVGEKDAFAYLNNIEPGNRV